MKYDLDGSTVQLREGEVVSLPDAKGSTIAVLWGSVWLTQDGDARDHELSAGDSFTIRGDGKVVVSAFEDSAVSILQPCADSTSALRYLTGEELRQFEQKAQELRAVYTASLIYGTVAAVGRAFTKLREYIAASWINGIRDEWVVRR